MCTPAITSKVSGNPLGLRCGRGVARIDGRYAYFHLMDPTCRCTIEWCGSEEEAWIQTICYAEHNDQDW